MVSNYKLIVGGGSEIDLDPGLQWTDDELSNILFSSTPQTLPVRGDGAVTFVPGPGVAIVREVAQGQVF